MSKSEITKIPIYNISNNTPNPISDMNSINTHALASIQLRLKKNPNDLDANADNVAHLLMQECRSNNDLL